MIEVTKLLEVFKQLEDSGVDPKDCVIFTDKVELPKDTEFMVVQKRDLPNA